MGQLDLWLGKLEVTNELGEQLDKHLEQAEHQAQQLKGGAAALKAGAEKVAKLGEHVSRDLEDGKLEVETALQVADHIRTYLRRATEVLLNLAEKSKSEELVAHGKAAALRGFMQTMQNHAKVAKARTQQLLAQAEELAKAQESEAETEGEPRAPRIPGQHPGRSSLDERRAEADRERAETEAKAVETSEEPATEDKGVTIQAEAEVSAEAEVIKPKKKRAKKKATKRAKKQPSAPPASPPWEEVGAGG